MLEGIVPWKASTCVHKNLNQTRLCYGKDNLFESFAPALGKQALGNRSLALLGILFTVLVCCFFDFCAPPPNTTPASREFAQPVPFLRVSFLSNLPTPPARLSDPVLCSGTRAPCARPTFATFRAHGNCRRMWFTEHVDRGFSLQRPYFRNGPPKRKAHLQYSKEPQRRGPGLEEEGGARGGDEVWRSTCRRLHHY